ncbi:MAG TPA: hypothetical protein VJ111_18475 [Chitinophagaceae bacterium]|nr:hypothetical protein [Chitinophagaceae bacterium]
MRKNLFLIILFTSFFLLSGCADNDTVKKVDPDAIYFDYRVWGDEENSAVTVRLQYFLSKENKNTVLLQHPGKVEFDGEVLPADSSRMNGYYYEARVPLENFAGKHSIVFSDHHEKKYTEEFEFSIISLKTEIPAVVSRKKLVLELNGINPGEIVRILLTDTSFYNRDIDRVDTLWNDSIIITPGDLENLKNGPVYLEIYKENEWPLKETTKGGGRISLSYGLKRVFELKDAAIP